MRIQSLSEQANRYTKAQLLLMECLQDKYIPYKSEYDIWGNDPEAEDGKAGASVVGNEVHKSNDSGQQTSANPVPTSPGFWFYRVDVYLPTKRVVLEVEGEGSHSRNNDIRDARIRSKDIEIVHLSNEVVLHHGGEIAALVSALL